MAARFNLLGDPRFEPLKASLHERVRAAANALDVSTFPDVFDPIMQGVLRSGFAAAGADEGTVWLTDRAGEALVPVFNTGPTAEQFVGKFRQPLSSGLISMVAVTEDPFCENEVYRNEKQDKTLDRSLRLVTHAMIAVPFYFAGGGPRGVISCVQLKPQDSEAVANPPGFPPESLRHVQLASEVLTRLIDHWLVGVTVGWQTG